MKIYTIGHTTRSLEEFVGVLKKYEVKILIDVRRVPKVKKIARFDGANLETSLVNEGISYLHIPELGSFRNTNIDSENADMKNTSFEGYADHMETDEFRRGFEMLSKIAASQNTVIMCYEALPEYCHRQFISDALSQSGVEIVHILNKNEHRIHKLTPFLRIVNGKLTYPGHS